VSHRRLTRRGARRKILPPVRFDAKFNMTRTSRGFRTLTLGIALCATIFFAGCGRKEAGPLSEGGETAPAAPGAKPEEATLEQQTEQKLDPLTKDDVELYMKVMRAAAERVKNPLAEDKTALDGARKVLAASAAGRVPTRDDVKTLERANLVALSMDQIVADEMKLDGRTYRGIAEAVETAVPNPALAITSHNGALPAKDRTSTPLEKRLSDAHDANEKFLMPNRAEIQKLIAIVRNPANLPK
jgi:predicted small lipoprotein YifL